MFLEELYKHPELGVTFGKFPEPTVAITKDYKCPSPRIRVETPSDSTETEDVDHLEGLEGLEGTIDANSQEHTEHPEQK